MIVEGIGKRTPGLRKIILTAGDIRTAAREGEKRLKERGYSDRKDAWGKGMTGAVVIANVCTVRDAAAPIVAGIIGEYAVVAHVNKRFGRQVCSVDLSLRNGDGGIDLAPFGLGIDVKARLKDYGKFLVRRRYANGREVRWTCDAFVFCEWQKSMTVDVFGWLWSKDIAARDVAPAKSGDWNVEVSHQELLPLSRLMDELESRRGAH